MGNRSPPSFFNYRCFLKGMIGHRIGVVVAVLVRLNIIAAELDHEGESKVRACVP